MATQTGSVKLIPSGNTGLTNITTSTNNSYKLENGYNDEDHSSNYARLVMQTSTTGHIYWTFDTSEIPASATITSISAKARVRVNNTNYITNTKCQLYTGTTAKGSNSTFASTSSSNIVTLTTGTWTRSELNNLRLYIGGTASSNSNNKYIYFYGASVTVNYSVSAYDITLTNNTSAEASLSETTVAEGGSADVMIDTLSNLIITDNGVNVTNSFGQMVGGTISSVPSDTFTVGYSSSSTAFYQSSSTSSTSWLEYAIGHSAESPYSTSNTSNTYAKPEGQTAWINYHFDFSEIPSTAIINSVSVAVYGARENSSVDSSHVAKFQCYSGNTAKGTAQEFTSTSNSKVTITDPGTWTRAELDDAQLRFAVGYYGGRMLGITWSVTYEVNGYIYTITNITADHAIVISNAGGSQPTIYYKVNGSWVAAVAVYKKVNGSWVLQSNLANVFDANTNYVKG